MTILHKWVCYHVHVLYPYITIKTARDLPGYNQYQLALLSTRNSDTVSFKGCFHHENNHNLNRNSNIRGFFTAQKSLAMWSNYACSIPWKLALIITNTAPHSLSVSYWKCISVWFDLHCKLRDYLKDTTLAWSECCLLCQHVYMYIKKLFESRFKSQPK